MILAHYVRADGSQQCVGSRPSSWRPNYVGDPSDPYLSREWVFVIVPLSSSILVEDFPQQITASTTISDKMTEAEADKLVDELRLLDIKKGGRSLCLLDSKSAVPHAGDTYIRSLPPPGHWWTDLVCLWIHRHAPQRKTELANITRNLSRLFPEMQTEEQKEYVNHARSPRFRFEKS